MKKNDINSFGGSIYQPDTEYLVNQMANKLYFKFEDIGIGPDLLILDETYPILNITQENSHFLEQCGAFASYFHDNRLIWLQRPGNYQPRYMNGKTRLVYPPDTRLYLCWDIQYAYETDGILHQVSFDELELAEDSLAQIENKALEAICEQRLPTMLEQLRRAEWKFEDTMLILDPKGAAAIQRAWGDQTIRYNCHSEIVFTEGIII